MRLSVLISILQMAVGPVIVISGVGLLLLSMTNRFGRVIDRSRLIAEGMRRAAPDARHRLSRQLDVLLHRARLIRISIILAATSVLLAACLIISLFIAALMDWEIGLLVAVLFIACMSSLIGSLIVFIGDINVSLTALKLEIDSSEPPKTGASERQPGSAA